MADVYVISYIFHVQDYQFLLLIPEKVEDRAHLAYFSRKKSNGIVKASFVDMSVFFPTYEEDMHIMQMPMLQEFCARKISETIPNKK